VHASDLHLGCQQYRNIHRSNDYLSALKEILNISKHHAVDFILFSGDIFTSIDILPGYFQQIIEILDEFKKECKIPIIAIEGNHDIRRYSHGSKFERGQSWLKVLSYLNLLILLDVQYNESGIINFRSYDEINKTGGKIQIKFAEIYGTRFFREKIKESIPKIENAIMDDGKFHILMQHFGIEGQMENVPGINVKNVGILKNKVQYLALGHYHLQYKLDGWIFNPGVPEPASVIEHSYKRGIFLVDVIKNEGFSVNVKSIKLRNRSIMWKSIKISHSFENYTGLSQYLNKKLIENLGNYKVNRHFSDLSKPILYLKLSGKIPFKNQKLNRRKLANLLKENLPVIDLRIYPKFTRNIRTLDDFQIHSASKIEVNTEISQEN
jgi:DNA repair exonuclease SbcCD nuclease subunit